MQTDNPTLPIEIWLFIFSYQTTTNELFNVFLVCKEWNAYANRIIKSRSALPILIRSNKWQKIHPLVKVVEPPLSLGELVDALRLCSAIGSATAYGVLEYLMNVSEARSGKFIDKSEFETIALENHNTRVYEHVLGWDNRNKYWDTIMHERKLKINTLGDS